MVTIGAFIVAERQNKRDGLLPEAPGTTLQLIAAVGTFVVVKVAKVNSVFLDFHRLAL